MSEIRLYHGSPNIVERPVFGYGNARNDYGLGFYCTEHQELAKEWACRENRDGFANEYVLETDSLSTLRLYSPEYHILNWISILLENRTFVLGDSIASAAREYLLENFLPPYRDFDIIRGYRADDSYFSFASAFLNNGISLQQLGRAMHLGELGEQVVVRSEKAFERLQFVGAEVAENEIYYPKRMARDIRAREDFRRQKERGAAAGEISEAESSAASRNLSTLLDETYIIDIVRNGWKNDDPRLR